LDLGGAAGRHEKQLYVFITRRRQDWWTFELRVVEKLKEMEEGDIDPS